MSVRRWPGARPPSSPNSGTEVPDAAFVKVADARAALAHAAARFYPRQPETIVAVTGTSGKTSVAAFVRQIWQALGREVRFDRDARRRVAPADRLRIADHPGSDRAP